MNNCMKRETNVMAIARRWEAGRCCQGVAGHLRPSVRKDLMVWRRDTALGWSEALPPSRGWWLSAERGEHKDSHQVWGTGTGQLRSKAIIHPAERRGRERCERAKCSADKGWGRHEQTRTLNYAAGLLLSHVSRLFLSHVSSFTWKYIAVDTLPSALQNPPPKKRQTKYSAESKNSRKIGKFLYITRCTPSPETLCSFPALLLQRMQWKAEQLGTSNANA